MFPFNYSKLFRSRWAALLWAAGICWIALDYAGGQSETARDETGAANASQAEIDQATQILKDIDGH